MEPRVPKSVLAFLIASCVAPCAFAESSPPAGAEARERFTIHVLTMDPGPELFARFGHIALVVEDAAAMTRKAYNFGTFDFDDPALRVKYARGFLTYWLSVSSYAGMVRRYKELDRTLVLRTLDLKPEEASLVARRLELNAQPENREYAYRHYLDNCCTRIRDLLDDVLGGVFQRQFGKKATGRSFRYWTRRALVGLPLTGTTVLFSLGPAIDRPVTRFEEEFLPEVLSQDIDLVRIGPEDRPLVKNKRVILSHVGPAVGKVVPPMELVPALVFLVALALCFGLPLALGRRRLSARAAGIGLALWGLVAGLGGLLLVLFFAATTHFDTHNNENLLVLPITHLWLIGPGFVLVRRASLGPRTARAVGWYLLFAIALLVIDLALKIGPFIQNNFEFIGFAALADVAALTALARAGVPALPQRRA